MKAVMRKLGEVALSVLLVSLICVPVPAMSAFADEANSETQDESELTPEQLLKLKQLKASQAEDAAEASEPSTEANETDANEPANANETNADSEVDGTTDSDDMTNVDEAPEATENADALTPDAEQPTTDIATNEKAAKAASSADASTVSTADELTAAFATANAYTGSGTYTITLADDIALPTSMSVAAGKNVTLAGDGHTLTLDGSAALEAKGTLTLDGLTIAASASHTGTMVVVDAGTLNMNSGVTIEGNDDDTAVTGGGVSVTNKGTFNMNGGTIENCAADKGGGVYVIASTFNMSGNATIRDCRTQTDSVKDTGNGGGVFLDTGKNPATTMTMSGNATIRDNSAVGVGGGVFVNTRATLTMEGNASIVCNAADAAGGVMNYGRATLTAVYGNTARQGADDIFNNARAQLKLSPTNPDWVLPRTGTHVTGWYRDYYHAVDQTGSQGDGGHRWAPENDDSVEYVPTDGFTTEMLTLTAGAPLVTVLWENEDGTVLYEMDNVKTDAIPTADEYTKLSGQNEPTEPDTADGQAHEFTGWTETHPSDNEVVYIANYKLVDSHDPNELADKPTAPTVDDPSAPLVTDPTAPAVVDPTNGATPQQAGTYSGTASDNTSVAGAALQQTGDHVANAAAAFVILMGLSVIALGAATAIRKRAK